MPVRRATVITIATGTTHQVLARTAAIWLHQSPVVLQAFDVLGLIPELGEELGIVFALTGGELPIVGCHLFTEVPWPTGNSDLAVLPVGNGSHGLPVVCPVTIGELFDRAQLAGGNFGLVELGVQRLHVGEGADPVLDDLMKRP